MSEREEAARAGDELRDLIESLTLLAGGCEFRDAQYLRDDIMRSIEQLEAQVEAAAMHLAAWDTMEQAVEEHREAMYEADCGQIVSPSYREALVKAIFEANAAEHRTAESLRAALKEADHD